MPEAPSPTPPEALIELLDQPWSAEVWVAAQEAATRAEELEPLLLGRLRQMLESPEVYASPSYEADLPTYVLYLLGSTGCREAHGVLIDLLEKPQGIGAVIFGDLIHEDVPRVLWQTSGGEIGELLDMARRTTVDPFCRSIGAHALFYGVADGELPLEEAMRMVGGLLAEEIGRGEPSDFIGLLISLLSDFPRGEVMDTIRGAYAAKLVPEDFMTLKDFEEYVKRMTDGSYDPDWALVQREAQLSWTAAESMEWLDPARKKEEDGQGGAGAAQDAGSGGAGSTRKKKEKRKMAKASRKKARVKKKKKKRKR